MSIKKSSKFIIAGIAVLVAALIIAAIATPAFAKQSSNNEAKRAVPFSEVNVNDGFMHDYIKLVICKVIPTAIKQVEYYDVEKGQCGGMYNIRNCAAWHEHGSKSEDRPDHIGALYVDSDVHKVLESMCMALDTPSSGDADIEAAQEYISGVLEDWIKVYVWAPEQKGSQYPGYFDTFWELDPGYTKYSNTDNHELYCQGHFIEAAVAHYRYQMHKNPGSPDNRLLQVALNSADHIAATFGADKERHQIPGHEEIELALIKLAKLYKEIDTTDNLDRAQSYIDTAAYFLEMRGHDWDKRTADNIILGKREYDQDHVPVAEQREAVGHAVRAQYLYTGMCELASIDPNYAKKYDAALNAVWESITKTKQYVTGGMGDDSNHNEGFNNPYYLPNYLSYCETCAGVANMLFNRSMSTLYDGSKYADQIETVLYNNVLGCVNFDGDKFYYQNKINTLGPFDRSTWFGTACCPPNFTRTILQAGGYVYNTTSDNIFINQYITNEAKFNFGNYNAEVSMQSGLPYEPSGKITIKPNYDGDFKVSLRNPQWSDGYSIKVNGQSITPKEKDGYLVIENQTWSSSGTTIEFNFNMPIKYEKSDPKVKENEGLVALRHGPLIYCLEAVDNQATPELRKASVTPNGAYNFEKVESIDGKANPYGVRTVYVLNHSGQYAGPDGIKDVNWRFIPYYARCNRTLGQMYIYVFDASANPLKTHQRANAAASASADMGPIGLNDATNDETMRWTNYGSELPNPWVWYDFDTPVKFKGFRIWWYESNSVKAADHIEFTVFNKQDGSEKTIELSNDNIVLSNDDRFVTYEFPEAYEGNAIKMTLYNKYIDGTMKYVGINEWELIDAESPVNPTPTDDPSYGLLGTGDNLLNWLMPLAFILITLLTSMICYRVFNKN